MESELVALRAAHTVRGRQLIQERATFASAIESALAEVDGAQARAAQVENALETARADAAQAEARAAELEAELAALKATKLFRSTRRLRRAYEWWLKR